MKIDIHKKTDYIVLELNGSLDIYTSLDFKSAIEDNIKDQGITVVINLENISYIDSSGIGTLIKTYNHLESLDGKFIIANLKPVIEKVFRVAGLTSYFTIIDEAEFKEKYPL